MELILTFFNRLATPPFFVTLSLPDLSLFKTMRNDPCQNKPKCAKINLLVVDCERGRLCLLFNRPTYLNGFIGVTYAEILQLEKERGVGGVLGLTKNLSLVRLLV